MPKRYFKRWRRRYSARCLCQFSIKFQQFRRKEYNPDSPGSSNAGFEFESGRKRTRTRILGFGIEVTRFGGRSYGYVRKMRRPGSEVARVRIRQEGMKQAKSVRINSPKNQRLTHPQIVRQDGVRNSMRYILYTTQYPPTPSPVRNLVAAKLQTSVTRPEAAPKIDMRKHML